jgi:hypothetical protein
LVIWSPIESVSARDIAPEGRKFEDLSESYPNPALERLMRVKSRRA